MGDACLCVGVGLKVAKGDGKGGRQRRRISSKRRVSNIWRPLFKFINERR